MENDILFAIARDIAKRVGEIIERSSDLGAYTGAIGEAGDRVRYGDQLVENGLKAIIPFVLEKYHVPGAVIISEESGQWEVFNPHESDGIFMIIDPIDGSRNLRPHPTPRPFVAFSIALGTMADLTRLGTFDAVRVGLIRDIFHKEEYYAGRGRGSYLNGLKLRASPVTDIGEAVLGASFDGRPAMKQSLLEQGIAKATAAARYLRRLGLSTLDLCRVASGDYDAHISLSGGVKILDIAAAKLIIEEAGGTLALFYKGKQANNVPWLSDLYNSKGANLKTFQFKIVAAGNTSLLQQVLSFLQIT
jgi:myo-inositol-1(or 4)-monophosphatase